MGLEYLGLSIDAPNELFNKIDLNFIYVIQFKDFMADSLHTITSALICMLILATIIVVVIGVIAAFTQHVIRFIRKQTSGVGQGTNGFSGGGPGGDLVSQRSSIPSNDLIEFLRVFEIVIKWLMSPEKSLYLEKPDDWTAISST